MGQTILVICAIISALGLIIISSIKAVSAITSSFRSLKDAVLEIKGDLSVHMTKISILEKNLDIWEGEVESLAEKYGKCQTKQECLQSQEIYLQGIQDVIKNIETRFNVLKNELNDRFLILKEEMCTHVQNIIENQNSKHV